MKSGGISGGKQAALGSTQSGVSFEPSGRKETSDGDSIAGKVVEPPTSKTTMGSEQTQLATNLASSTGDLLPIGRFLRDVNRDLDIGRRHGGNSGCDGYNRGDFR